MKLLKWLLIIVAAGQLAIPAYMIYRQETTLREGRVYKFRTRPVDPADALRGRYVWLGFEQEAAAWPGKVQGQYRGPAFARVEEGANGFAVVRELSMEPPAEGDSFKVQVRYISWGAGTGTAHFTMPFDRYYMEETKAPKAERAYWEHNHRGHTNLATYAVVRVKDGHAALENLFVGGKPIVDYVTEQGK